jgi:hypothetical protein
MAKEKIEKSFNFLDSITVGKELNIYYVGDLDPEGWGIYVRLAECYPTANIQLAIPIYEALLEQQMSNKTEPIKMRT